MSGRSSPCDGEGDDFTRISGVGKVFDRRLHQAGVNSYADLAALNPEGIASRLAEPAVRPGRIGGEDWTGQAARLAEEATAGEARTAAENAEDAEDAEDAVAPSAAGAPAGSPEASSAVDATGLHYQSFVVRILLRESDGRVASTTVQHVGSGAERRWPGLNKPDLLDFISAYLSPAAAAPVVQPSSSPPGDVPLTLARDLRVPRAQEPFTVSISLDLTEVEPPAEPPVRFSAIVLARPLSRAAAQVVSRENGIVSGGAPVIKLHSAGLPGGTYRLEAVVELIESHGRRRGLVASVEGGILVVAGPGAIDEMSQADASM